MSLRVLGAEHPDTLLRIATSLERGEHKGKGKRRSMQHSSKTHGMDYVIRSPIDFNTSRAKKSVI